MSECKSDVVCVLDVDPRKENTPEARTYALVHELTPERNRLPTGTERKTNCPRPERATGQTHVDDHSRIPGGACVLRALCHAQTHVYAVCTHIPCDTGGSVSALL